MLYVTDTHSLVWFLTNDAKLGKNARKIFDKAETGENTIVIPTIVLAEILYIAEKKNIAIKFKDVLEKISNSLNYPTYNLDVPVLLRAYILNKVPEMHDKIIIATAQLINAKLITDDKAIKKSGYVKIIW